MMIQMIINVYGRTLLALYCVGAFRWKDTNVTPHHFYCTSTFLFDSAKELHTPSSFLFSKENFECKVITLILWKNSLFIFFSEGSTASWNISRIIVTLLQVSSFTLSWFKVHIAIFYNANQFSVCSGFTK